MTIAGGRETRSGPFVGVRVVEFAGMGPGPYCGQLLADLGAEILVIERLSEAGPRNPINDRGKARLPLDIRTPDGSRRALDAILHADVLIEGFRPGVMERLGFGPDEVLAKNSRLIYGRMTGWGQEGPLAKFAGHDINYIALTGALAAIGPVNGAAIPPLNLVGDFGGGSLFLAFGIAAALFERERSGAGQVIDSAIIDGVASLMSMFSGLQRPGGLSLDRERNLLGGAAPFYRTYRCADGREVAVGSIEPHFFRELLRRIGAPEELLEQQTNPALWPRRGAELESIFATRTRDEWAALLEGTDACLAPVLELKEAPDHAQMSARHVYQERDGVAHPAPAPRFSRTPGAITAVTDGEALLAQWLKT